MIVGGYTLDLYCDGPGCKNGKDVPVAAKATFCGPERAQCFTQAQKAGWRVQRVRSPWQAYCPACVSAGNT